MKKLGKLLFTKDYIERLWNFIKTNNNEKFGQKDTIIAILRLIDGLFKNSEDWDAIRINPDGELKPISIKDLPDIGTLDSSDVLEIIDITTGLPTKVTAQEIANLYNTDATTTVKGLLEVATLAEVQANTAIGSTGASLIATPDVLNQVYQKNTLTEDYIWVGNASNVTEEQLLSSIVYEEISYDALKALKDANNLDVSKRYLINTSLKRTHLNTNGNILIKPVSVSELDTTAKYFALVPDYQTFPIWEASTNANTVIWNGKTFNFNIGSKSSEPETNSDWTEVPNSITEIDNILYDFDTDTIRYREDKRGNQMDWAGMIALQKTSNQSFTFTTEDGFIDLVQGELSGTPIQNNSVISGVLPTNSVNNRAIAMQKDLDGNCYGFVVDSATDVLYRLDFGNSFNNIPSKVSLGVLSNCENVLFISTFYNEKNSKWYLLYQNSVFNDSSRNTISIYEFNTALASSLTFVKSVTLDDGTANGGGAYGMTVFVENSEIKVFFANKHTLGGDSFDFCVYNFGDSILNIHTEEVRNRVSFSIGFNGRERAFSTLIKENAKYYFFYATDTVGEELNRLDFGNSLSNTPSIVNLSSFGTGATIANVTSVQDNGKLYLFVGDNFTPSVMHKIELENAEDLSPTITNYSLSSLAALIGITSVRSQTETWIFWIDANGNTFSGSSSRVQSLYFSETQSLESNDYYSLDYIDNIENFQWGNDKVNDVRVKHDSFLELLNYKGIIRDSNIESRSKIINLTSNSNTAIQSCEISNGSIENTDLTNGQLVACTIKNFTINNETIPVLVENQNCVPGFSNFWRTYDITGLSVIDLSNQPHIGRIILTSSNATETITDILQDENSNHELTIEVDAGLTVDFVHSSNLRLPSATNILVIGNNYEIIKFRQSNLVAGEWLFMYTNKKLL